MALESLPKIAPALFSAEQDLIQIYNKKTDTTGVINASLLGGSTPPSGVSGAIQFSTGSAFGSDSANLFWDDTNKRLGIGTTTPLGILHLKRTADTTRMVMDGDAGQSKIITYRTAGLQRFGLYVNNTAESGSNAGSDFAIRAYNDAGTLLNTPVFIKRSTGNVGINTITGTAKLQVVGSGTTSGTTSLLVQNSAGQMALQVTDDKNVSIGNRLLLNGTFDQMYALGSAPIAIRGYHGVQVSRGTGVTSTMFEVFDEAATTGGLLVNVKNSTYPNMLSVNHLGNVGIGTNTPISSLDVRGVVFVQNPSNTDGALQVGTNGGGFIVGVANRTDVSLKSNAIMTTRGTGITFRANAGEPNGAVVGVVGSGSTSATTSLLVQNSAGSQGLKIDDNSGFQIGSMAAAGQGQGIRTDSGGGGINAGINTNFNNGATWNDDANVCALKIAYNNGIRIANTTRYPLTLGSDTKAVASAQLEMVSTTQGFLMPRMTTAEINAIASPANGLQVYNTTLSCPCFYDGTAWRKVSHSAM
jgi:hypothetical protein